MHDEPGTGGAVAEADKALERAILGLLVEEPGAHVWAVVDLQRELDNELGVLDGLERLRRAGLVHVVSGQCVFASRAAHRSHELW